MNFVGSPLRVVIGITGASGAVLGVRLLEVMKENEGIEVHLVVSDAAKLTLRHEMGIKVDQLKKYVNKYYECKDIGAAIASGSYPCDCMIVAPCSMRTLAAIAIGLSDNLITRAADVMLKERRKLLLLTREAPLNLAHLRNMVAVTEMGGIIFPPVPAYYNHPVTIEEATDYTIARALDVSGVQNTRKIWGGLC